MRWCYTLTREDEETLILKELYYEDSESVSCTKDGVTFSGDTVEVVLTGLTMALNDIINYEYQYESQLHPPIPRDADGREALYSLVMKELGRKSSVYQTAINDVLNIIEECDGYSIGADGYGDHQTANHMSEYIEALKTLLDKDK